MSSLPRVAVPLDHLTDAGVAALCASYSIQPGADPRSSLRAASVGVFAAASVRLPDPRLPSSQVLFASHFVAPASVAAGALPAAAAPAPAPAPVPPAAAAAGGGGSGGSGGGAAAAQPDPALLALQQQLAALQHLVLSSGVASTDVSRPISLPPSYAALVGDSLLSFAPLSAGERAVLCGALPSFDPWPRVPSLGDERVLITHPVLTGLLDKTLPAIQRDFLDAARFLLARFDDSPATLQLFQLLLNSATRTAHGARRTFASAAGLKLEPISTPLSTPLVASADLQRALSSKQLLDKLRGTRAGTSRKHDGSGRERGGRGRSRGRGSSRGRHFRGRPSRPPPSAPSGASAASSQ